MFLGLLYSTMSFSLLFLIYFFLSMFIFHYFYYSMFLKLLVIFHFNFFFFLATPFYFLTVLYIVFKFVFFALHCLFYLLYFLRLLRHFYLCLSNLNACFTLLSIFNFPQFCLLQEADIDGDQHVSFEEFRQKLEYSFINIIIVTILGLNYYMQAFGIPSFTVDTL